MKKVFCLFILSTFVLCFASDVYSAAAKQSLDFNTFDNFIIEQAQNTFLNSICSLNDLQQTDSADNKCNNIYFSYYEIQNSLSSEIKNLANPLYLCSYDGMNKIYDCPFSLKNNTGIGKYKIKLNSYLALITDNKLSNIKFI